ncbi:MAG: hypothetical protein P9X24_12240 [Candidatus Hatepunaea meridiana]|nr:hypothetical protein [Candidatus Hatepunaea meridiana]
MGKSSKYMAAVLIGAAIITFFVGDLGINLVKLAGIVLASLAVLPVFFLLVLAMRSGEMKRIMITFVGGFFFKLGVLLFGVWWALTKSGWELISFTVSCLVFVFAFQVCESLYFWANKENTK